MRLQAVVGPAATMGQGRRPGHLAHSFFPRAWFPPGLGEAACFRFRTDVPGELEEECRTASPCPVPTPEGCQEL